MIGQRWSFCDRLGRVVAIVVCDAATAALLAADTGTIARRL